jgi:hypothetical protein
VHLAEDKGCVGVQADAAVGAERRQPTLAGADLTAAAAVVVAVQTTRQSDPLLQPA